mmetsp:Transcript_144340/g.402166  ORF Transcript_144340/g.402166 Transcript_144340/m.402166 type:complete len:129 (-) Transcript_144340:80-466(-)
MVGHRLGRRRWGAHLAVVGAIAAAGLRASRAMAGAAAAREVVASPKVPHVARRAEEGERGAGDLVEPRERPPNIREVRQEQTVVFSFVFSLILVAVGIYYAFPTSLRPSYSAPSPMAVPPLSAEASRT